VSNSSDIADEVPFLVSFFTVAYYDVAVRRSPSGLSRGLYLYSADTDPAPGSAQIWFGPQSAAGTIGTATLETPRNITVFLPIDEIDGWLDILRGNARANFGYALNHSEPSLHEANIAQVVLSTKRDPLSH
jgi:hypothetical protein